VLDDTDDEDDDVLTPAATQPAAQGAPVPAPAPAVEPEAAAPAKQTYTPLQATLMLAQRGNPACLQPLRKALDEHPEIWQHYGDLGGAVERTWIMQIAEKDLLITESVTRQLDALRQELGGANRLEKLIVERIVSAWLQVQHAEHGLADSGQEGLRLRQFRLRQVESAERRFQAASRNLALVRRLLGGVEMHITHEHKVNLPLPASAPAVDPAPGAESPSAAVGERREQLFGATAPRAMVKEMEHA